MVEGGAKRQAAGKHEGGMPMMNGQMGSRQLTQNTIS
jgi:hypothetical protein